MTQSCTPWRLLCKCLIAALLSTAAAVQLPAQETAPTDAAEQVDAPVESVPPDITPDAAPTESDSEPEETLTRKTLEQDIQNLDYFQLVTWLGRLELSTQGDINQLRQRLLGHFNVIPAAAAGIDTQNDVEVIIESALSGNYFDIEQVDERYIRLQGGVQLMLIDNVENATHTIRAEELIFNQEQELVTARGEVEYFIDRDGSREEFSGHTLVFELDGWQGIFLGGRGNREPTGDQQSGFRYEAGQITRSPDDIVVMEDVTVTSSPSADPYYHLKAEKIWLIGPAEWALSNAVLYVGEVPLFYFPYFFRPGDEIIFHPVFGTRDREGAFIQTTTYLIGRKERSAVDSLSFLQSTNTVNRAQTVDGIFLRNTTEPYNPATSATLRLLVDYYSRLGGYIELEGDFNGVNDVVNTINFDTALAVSNHIYPGAGGDYTTLFVSNGTATEQLVHSNFFGTEVPFRYLIDLQIGMSVGSFRSSLLLQYYSDRYIISEFDDRAEENDWYGIVLGEEDLVTTTTLSETSSFLWRSESSYSVPNLPSPFISNLALNNFLLSVNWTSKDYTNPPPHIATATFSPESDFYVPNTIFAPNIGVSLSGTLLSPDIIAGTAASAAEESSVINAELRPPWEATDPETEEIVDDDDAPPVWTPPDASETDFSFRDQTTRTNYGGYQIRRPLDYGLTYSLTPDFSFQHITNNIEWNTPADIDFSLRYSTLTLDNSLDFGLFFDLYENYLRLNTNFTTRGRYRTTFDGEAITETDRDRERRADFAYNYFSIDNSSTLSTNFLQAIPQWASTSASYTISSHLYQYRFDQFENGNSDEPIYESLPAEWDREFITAHNTALNLIWDTPIGREALTLSYRLPPHLQQFSANLALQFGPVALATNLSVSEPGDAAGDPDPTRPWEFNPLVTTASITFLDELVLSGNMRVNLNDEFIDTVSASLRTWFVTTSLELERTEAFVFNFTNDGTLPWQETGEPDLRPTTLRISASENVQSDPLWKGRVRVGGNISASLSFDLLRFTESAFSMNYGISLFVFEFIDISLSATVTNDLVYIYVPELAAQTGATPRNFFVDFLQSINIFNQTDLETGLFKLQNISLNIAHRLVDWDLIFGYTASPVLDTSVTPNNYIFEQQFTVSIAWRPIPELKRDIVIDNDDQVTIE